MSPLFRKASIPLDARTPKENTYPLPSITKVSTQNLSKGLLNFQELKCPPFKGPTMTCVFKDQLRGSFTFSSRGGGEGGQPIPNSKSFPYKNWVEISKPEN